jgi:hypothetical protein
LYFDYTLTDIFFFVIFLMEQVWHYVTVYWKVSGEAVVEESAEHAELPLCAKPRVSAPTFVSPSPLPTLADQLHKTRNFQAHFKRCIVGSQNNDSAKFYTSCGDSTGLNADLVPLEEKLYHAVASHIDLLIMSMQVDRAEIAESPATRKQFYILQTKTVAAYSLFLSEVQSFCR